MASRVDMTAVTSCEEVIYHVTSWSSDYGSGRLPGRHFQLELYWKGLFVYFWVCCLLFTLFSPSNWPLKCQCLQLKLDKHTHPVEPSTQAAAPGEYYPLCIQYKRSANRVHQSADIWWRCTECYGGQFVKIHWTRDHGSSGQQQGPIKLHLCHHYSHEWRW